MSNYLYVDNSNVWIEGMHVAAVHAGMAPDIYVAQDANITDGRWRLDFGKLFDFAGGPRSDVGRAVLFGSRPPPNDSLWSAAERHGFEVIVYDRNIRGREKKVDVSIATEMMQDSYERMDPAVDEITLIAGDSDYVPTVESICARGIRFYVAFWDHASRELKSACTEFVSLDPYLDLLAR
jgi:hypothetical protein